MRLFATLISGTVAFGGATLVLAGNLPVPEGAPLLTVTGALSVTNSDNAAVFDLSLLRQMGGETITTSTIWTEGVITFEGVRLSDLLESLQIEAGTLDMVAINDYAVQIPVDDARVGPALIAYEMNGAEMSVRDKGPLWLIYPYDEDPEYRSETYHARSIWQLDRITVSE